MIEVVGIRVAAGDGEDAGADHVLDRVDDAGRVALIGEEAGEPLGDSETALGQGEQQDAAIRGEPPAVEGGCDLLARNGWEAEWQGRSGGHGGCGGLG